MKFLGLILVVVVLWKITPTDISLLGFVALTVGVMFVLSLIAKRF